MRSGYLTIRTHPKHPDQIQINQWDELPKVPDNKNKADKPYGTNVHYVSWFNDILAAMLHTHNGLRNKLFDANQHLYSVNIIDGISVIESNDDLKHRQIWIDPKLSIEDMALIHNKILQNKIRKKRVNKIIQVVGFIGILLLILNFFSSIY